MSHKDGKGQLSQSQGQSGRTPKISRRTLIRNVAVGMPAVLTLQSGAALARSSNVVGVAPPGTRDLDGSAICLDTSGTESVPGANQIDLGEPAEGNVNLLSDRIYYTEPNVSATPLSADMVCQRGGAYYYNDNGWKEINLPTNGVIVSATAIVSVSLRGDILFNRIA